MRTRSDVATALGITDKQLCGLLYGLRLRRQYREFKIPKRSGGVRIVSAPPPQLLELQRRLIAVLSAAYNPKQCVHGFVRERSIVSNAARHLGARHILNFDLADFFPSIHIGRVKGVFAHPPFSFGNDASEVIAQICCRDDGKLPQGGGAHLPCWQIWSAEGSTQG